MNYLILTTLAEARIEKRDTPYSLKEMQDIVGGYIEFDHSPTIIDDYTMPLTYPEFIVCVNEDGFGDGLPLNPFLPKYAGDVIIGVDLRLPDTEGYTFCGLDDDHLFIKGDAVGEVEIRDERDSSIKKRVYPFTFEFMKFSEEMCEVVTAIMNKSKKGTVFSEE